LTPRAPTKEGEGYTKEMSVDLSDILDVIRTELLDPGWGQQKSDVFNPDKDMSPRIVAEKIARALQSTVSIDPSRPAESAGFTRMSS
jgi:hypothetical protein